MRRLLQALLVFGMAGTAVAEEPRIDVVGKGLYRIETGEALQKPDVPGGTVTPAVKFSQIESTTTVPARIGVEFGFEYVVVGEPEGTEVTLEFVDTYPAPGLADPQEATPFQTARFERARKIGETLYTGYGFESDWELVPGVWTFEIWHDGRKLAEESFTVVVE